MKRPDEVQYQQKALAYGVSDCEHLQGPGTASCREVTCLL